LKTAIICLSEDGYKLSQIIKSGLKQRQTGIFVPEKISDSALNKDFTFTYPLSDLVSKIFNDYDSLVFIMALGIVIRVIAPFINNKSEDPAVITLDESAKYCISTLGGHEAGANKLTKEIAEITGASPVITTASEGNGIVIGIGLKKNKSKEEIKNAILSALNKKNLNINEVKKILTIDIKKSDQELKKACFELSVPLYFVSKKQINSMDAVYETSDFVDKNIGVKAVSQPAALIGSDNKQIIMERTAYNGITIAIAR
jgi:cobalt-precorrin 5A hydrolase